MNKTLCTIALTVGFVAQPAIAQVAEPDIRVIGAGVRAGGAQDNIGAGIGKRAAPADFVLIPGKSKEDVTRSFLIDFGRCIVAMDKSGVDRLIGLVPGTDAYSKTAKRVAANQCMATGDMRIPHSSLQGAVFIYKYKTEFGARVPVLRDAAVDYAGITTGAPADWASRYVALRRFGECVVRREPAAARALAIGPVGSGAEAGAVQTLGPSFSACLDAGSNVNFTKERLSGLVAEVLYRLSIPEGSR